MDTVILQDAELIANADFVDWSALSGKTVFITGATGFIGSTMVRGLMCRNKKCGTNIKVVGMVRNLSKAEAMFSDYKGDRLLSFAIGDVCDQVNYDGEVDYVVHCASNAGPREYAENPYGTMQINFQGTTNLLTFAKEKNVSNFLYVSTIEIYGTTKGCEKIKETDDGYIDSIKTRSCYPISKKACETLSICYGSQYNIPVCVGRLSYIYGAGMKKDDSKIVAILARAAAARQPMVMMSKGEQNRSYTYVADAITGLLTVLTKGEAGQAYNVASELSTTTIAGIGYTLEDMYKDEGVKLEFNIPEQNMNFSPIGDAVMDNTKIKMLGYQAQLNLHQGMKRMVESIMENK